MENVGQDFVDFLLSESPDVAFTQWIKEITQRYRETIHCPICGNKTVDIIVAPKAFIRCGACNTRNEIFVDNLPPMNYADVTFVQEDIIRSILGVLDDIRV